MLSTSVPKPSPRWTLKQWKRAKQAKARVACCRLVDTRERHRCRVCGVAVRTDGLDMTKAPEHHELIPRSRGGDPTDTNTVILLCRKCHRREHEGYIRLSGDADTRHGVKLEVPSEAGWRVTDWI